MRRFEIVKDEFRKHPNCTIDLPERGTAYSAGYDIKTPVDIVVEPNESVLVFSDIRIKLNQGEVLQLYPRSSVGIKKGITLGNTVGIIDADYYDNPDTGGNIGISLFNRTNKTVSLKAGERIVQGVIMEYLITDNDNAFDRQRQGGFGSTGEN